MKKRIFNLIFAAALVLLMGSSAVNACSVWSQSGRCLAYGVPSWGVGAFPYYTPYNLYGAFARSAKTPRAQEIEQEGKAAQRRSRAFIDCTKNSKIEDGPTRVRYCYVLTQPTETGPISPETSSRVYGELSGQTQAEYNRRP